MVRVSSHLDDESSRQLGMLYFSAASDPINGEDGRKSKPVESRPKIDRDVPKMRGANSASGRAKTKKPKVLRGVAPSRPVTNKVHQVVGADHASVLFNYPKTDASQQLRRSSADDFAPMERAVAMLCIEEDRFRWLCRKNKIVMVSADGGLFVLKTDVEVLRDELIRSASPIYLRTVARLESRTIEQLKSACTAKHVQVFTDPVKGPMISVAKLSELLESLRRRPVEGSQSTDGHRFSSEPNASRNLKSVDGTWNVEGNPLKRYEENEAKNRRQATALSAGNNGIGKASTEKVPFIRIVSGGLPTLGKGHK